MVVEVVVVVIRPESHSFAVLSHDPVTMYLLSRVAATLDTPPLPANVLTGGVTTMWDGPAAAIAAVVGQGGQRCTAAAE